MKNVLLLCLWAVVVLTAISLLPGLSAPVPTGKVQRTLTNSIGMKFVYIPPGKFVMGSPKSEIDRSHVENEHEVEITKGFYLGAYEVTQAEYEKVMGSNPSYFSRNGERKEEVAGLDTSAFPVDYVSWNDAQVFIKKLNGLAAETTARRVYRLPTEAEWEYACRGGQAVKTPFHYGTALSSDQANLCGRLPYGGAKEGSWLKRTTRVGSYKPNPFGLYDMHGNVAEWCQDGYDPDYYARSPRRDPLNTEERKTRVIRGGSWDSGAHDCRSGYRGPVKSDHRWHYIGIRVALNP